MIKIAKNYMFYEYKIYEIHLSYWNSIHIKYKSFVWQKTNVTTLLMMRIFWGFYHLNLIKLAFINFILCKKKLLGIMQWAMTGTKHRRYGESTRYKCNGHTPFKKLSFDNSLPRKNQNYPPYFSQFYVYIIFS